MTVTQANFAFYDADNPIGTLENRKLMLHLKQIYSVFLIAWMAGAWRFTMKNCVNLSESVDNIAVFVLFLGNCVKAGIILGSFGCPTLATYYWEKIF